MVKISRWLGALLLALTFIATPALASAQTFFNISFGSVGFGGGILVDFAPPALPYYSQPPCPGPNFIWMPGYWAWGDGGYYWVPGTWVAAPEPGLYWTPGYWGWDGDYDSYVWNQGYWAPQVGFYGGIDYGFGYYGNGYVGGRWFGDAFRYNTAVTNVNITIVRNVYIDRTVVINNYDRYDRVSFNGGAYGIQARPTQRDLSLLNDRRFPMTDAQRQHVQIAAQDRNLLATVNHGTPNVLTVRRPLNTDSRLTDFTPIRQADRAAASVHVRNTQVQDVRAPQQQQQVQYRAPQQQQQVQYRAPQQQQQVQYRAPQQQQQVQYRAPQVQQVQQYRAPQQQQQVQYRAPQVQQYRVPQQQQMQYRAPQVQQYRMPQQQQVQYRAPQVQQYRMPQQQQVQYYRAPQVQQYRMPQQQVQYRAPQVQQYRAPQQQTQYRAPQVQYRPRPTRTPPAK
jgi:hypothetical protein